MLRPRLAKDKAQFADLLGESQLLRIERSDLQRRGLAEDRLTVCPLRVLVDGDDRMSAAVRRSPGSFRRHLPCDEDVDRIAWLDEARNAGNVVHADRGGRMPSGRR